MQGEVRMPDGKDTLVKSMKVPCLHRALDRPIGVTEPPQLPDRNDTVLAVSQRRQSMPPR